jgi:hypothetical protein
MAYEEIKELCSKIAEEPDNRKLIPLLKRLREDLAKIRVASPETVTTKAK